MRATDHYRITTAPHLGIGNVITAQQLQSDLKTHHIEGIAAANDKGFSCPLISKVTDDLWQGGCVNGVTLQGYFKHIVSLYPWERYVPGADLDSFLEVRLYDGPTVPDETQLYAIANHVNFCRKHGRTLVHCQAGLNRSGLVSGLALILGGMTPDDAIRLLRSARGTDQVLCNWHFAAWLREQVAPKAPRKKVARKQKVPKALAPKVS